MDWIVVEGVKPWDGRYPLDLDGAELTSREWGWIKRLTGYLPFTVDEGFAGGDPELFACFAVLALRRAGRIEKGDVSDVYERIIDGPAAGTVRLESDSEETETDAGPPASSNSGNESSSGAVSPSSSERSEPTRNGSGTPVSAGAESEWETSAI